jgi:hypothetical protein
MTAVRLAPHHPETPQARVHTVLRALIYRIGVRETGRLIGCDEDTVGRRLATGHLNSFGPDDLIQLKKRERDEFGTRELHDAETDAIYGKAPVTSEINLGAVLHREISEDASIIGRASRIMADGKVDAKDLADLEALVPELQAHMEHVQELETSVRRKVEALKAGLR